MSTELSYIILTGGRSTRLGSDKATTEIGGQSLLLRLITALTHDSTILVVGDEVEGIQGVSWIREEPAFSGPASAISAALPSISTDCVAVIAVDMPYGAEIIASLNSRSMAGTDALIPVDGEDFPQSLSAIYRTDSLRTAVDSVQPIAGKAMRELLTHLNYTAVRLGEDFATKLIDIDTPDDLEKVRHARVD